MSKLRYFWNVISGTKRAMLNEGAREETCPHCGKLTPIYYHQACKGTSGCLWCGKSIEEHFCQICYKPFEKGEVPWTDFKAGIYGGAHKDCLARMK